MVLSKVIQTNKESISEAVKTVPQLKKLSFIDAYGVYHNMRTVAPKQFGVHLAIQLLGHSMGRNSFCRIQPRAIHMNTYLGLNGPSGRGKKTTAQNDVASPLIPYEFRGYSSYSPEGLMRALSETHNVNAPLGEFSSTLRSIKMNGNMSNFKEITNDLWDVPSSYKKKLTNELYELDTPYLSMSTTCTEEEFYKNIDGPMVHGGFLPRWLFVYGTTPHRKRTKLPKNIDIIEQLFSIIIQSCYNYFVANPVTFELLDEAEDYFDEICVEWEDNEDWENVQPFVSRYESYIIKYACILKISELVGRAYLTYLTKLTTLTNLTDLTKDNDVNLVYLVKAVKSVTVDGVISINSTDIERAYHLIKPCLTYAKKITQYVDEDLLIVKLKRVFDKFGLPIEHSKSMQYSHLTKPQMKIATDTLYERKEVTIATIVQNKKGTKVSTVYCNKKCTDCMYSTDCTTKVIE